MTLSYLDLAGILILVFFLGRASKSVAAPQDTGFYPAPGKATMADVERLLRLGYKVSAVRCYREINQISLTEAKRRVEDMAMGKSSN
jgi:ribosomal protein L7/L12